MTEESDLTRLIPKLFLELIRDRIKAGISNAEAAFALNQDEEDAITGALGQAISTQEKLIFNAPEGSYTFDIKSFKLRGRGKDAPEKMLGADGIFQVAVFNNEKCIFKKGLPFQAKKMGGFNNAQVISQARNLVKTTETGIIVRYSPDGYTAVDALHLANDAHTEIEPQKLTTVIGDDFLNCRVGKLGLRFDREAVFNDKQGLWVFDTTIQARKPMS